MEPIKGSDQVAGFSIEQLEGDPQTQQRALALLLLESLRREQSSLQTIDGLARLLDAVVRRVGAQTLPRVVRDAVKVAIENGHAFSERLPAVQVSIAAATAALDAQDAKRRES
jgi:hypothetical protein